MSYDLMVFRPDIAPRTRVEFLKWYHIQVQWSEGHSYSDPAVTSDNLKNWFFEMIESFPALNGPYAKDEDDVDDYTTDYCIGKDVIYVTFAWSLAESAYEKMKTLAEKHQVGFFDVSSNEGDILFPDNNGLNRSIDSMNNLSSIQQIKESVELGEQDKSVQEIVYGKVLPQIMEQSVKNENKKTRSWWKNLFGLK